MSPVVVAVLVFVLVFGAALAGIAIRAALPEHHVADASKDTVARAAGLVVTLTALVLGFMVGSAKSYYDEVQDKLKRIAANAIVLDRSLVRFGPDGIEARLLLRQTLGSASRNLWPDHPTTLPALQAGRAIDGLERLQDLIHALPARDDGQRVSQARALQSAIEISHDGWLLVELAQTRIQKPLVVIIVLWLVIIFLGFGLLAPRNHTAATALLLSALAAAGALFLILEMYDPVGGLMRIPPSTLEISLEQIGK
jgi:hypothetical protein